MTEQPIRVASVPADHPYVRHLGAPGGDAVVRLADEREPGQRGWWPPRMLEPELGRASTPTSSTSSTSSSASTAATPSSCASWSSSCGELGKPLVYTVHDLRNPNHDERGLHDEQMAVLIEAADALVTLTDCAAAADRGALRPPARR